MTSEEYSHSAPAAEGGVKKLTGPRQNQLSDDIFLALDAISGPQPNARDLAEASKYLVHALRLIKSGVSA